MKIVWTDNFDREMIDEWVVVANIPQEEAERHLKELRAKCADDGPDWYKIVPDDYVPRKWNPNI